MNPHALVRPQQNGVAERKNDHLLANTRAFLFQKNVPKSYWKEAILTAAHLINRLPSRVLRFKSPMEVLSNFFPNFQSSTVLVPKKIGCVSFVHVHAHHRGKLDPRAIKCILWGILLLKRVTNATIHKLENSMSLQM